MIHHWNVDGIHGTNEKYYLNTMYYAKRMLLILAEDRLQQMLNGSSIHLYISPETCRLIRRIALLRQIYILE